MILIDNPYHTPTKHCPNSQFCPMGIINREKYCTMPCFFYDSIFCTYQISNYNQKKAAKEWENAIKYEKERLQQAK